LKLQCDEPLSNFAFKFDLRRYTKDQEALREALVRLGDRDAEPVAAAA
jgi:hypothetical protein